MIDPAALRAIADELEAAQVRAAEGLRALLDRAPNLTPDAPHVEAVKHEEQVDQVPEAGERPGGDG